MSEKVVSIATLQAAAMAVAAAAPQGGCLTAVADSGKPLCVDGLEFLDLATSPKWLVEGLLQRGHVVALTAATNSGKTALLLLLMMSVITGAPFGSKPVRHRGRVLMLCGEDADGFRLRMLGTMGHMGISRRELAGCLRIIPQSMSLSEALPKIEREVAEWGDLALVVVDTSVAFFSGSDENDNRQAYAHAQDLRALQGLPGHPTVVAACHPASDAERARCKPRGGSAFLNEIDCNLILWSEGDGVTELHWSVKKRGPDFEPVWFEFGAHEVVLNEERSYQVVAIHVDEDRAFERKKQHYYEDNRLLVAMLDAPMGSLRDWARTSGFMCGVGGINPQTSKVQRCLVRLTRNQLVVRGFSPSCYVLTPRGKTTAESAKNDHGKPA